MRLIINKIYETIYVKNSSISFNEKIWAVSLGIVPITITLLFLINILS